MAQPVIADEPSDEPVSLEPGVDGLFASGGEVGRYLATVDWTATPLGPPTSWPQSLRTVVRVLLSSRFSMWMAWGPELTFFCNDAYRRDTLGQKYPWALGKPASEVWAEIWPDIGPRVAAVMTTGTASWEEALLLFLERSGYVEETYHTFSYSPLTDDAGDIVGMLCVVSEETDRVIAERRMETLRELGADPTASRTELEVCQRAERQLARNTRDLPFTLMYLFDHDPTTARLMFSTGVSAGTALAPTVLDATTRSPWPAERILAGESSIVVALSDLNALNDADDADDGDEADRAYSVPTGAWDQPPEYVLVVALAQQGLARPSGLLVAGLNRYRPLDREYAGFVELIAGQVGAAIASARAYEAERRRAETLAELDRVKTAFFTNVSHEFRTPLTLLLGPAEDALNDADQALPAAQRSRVEVIHRNGQRLLKLVNSLLDFSRLESGTATARYEPLDLARYTAELASMFEPAIERAGLVLTLDCAPLPRPVHVDAEMWAKVVLNLVSNAFKFTFEGGISVSLHESQGMAELVVADTGTGIDASQQEHLFERFHRVLGARSRTHEGSGIGLALVAELAALHGGSVSVQSAPGAGSAFTVRIPFGTDHLPAGQVSERNADVLEPAQRHGAGFLGEALRWLEQDGELASNASGPRVLVVDDNADMRAYISSVLRDAYTIETANDGAAALVQARRQPPDLVLTDVMMPNLDGFGLLNALRADPATAHVPVVMLSARAGEEATVEGLEAGADDYLIKPFSARELRARVKANVELDRARRTRLHLERSQQLLDRAQRLARVGSWEMDVETGAVAGSDEFYRQLQTTPEELARQGLEVALEGLVHPDDRARVRDAIDAAINGEPLEFEVRVVLPDRTVRTHHVLGEVEHDSAGQPIRLRGSLQDVTDAREAERTLAAAAAAQEAARREHTIADELQRSLLPPRAFDPEHLGVATYYRAGVEGTQVGGDWYDVIQLGAGRTALVMGDVMGRGVRAAAVMGQLRSAVRAYARLDLPPSDILEYLDGVVRDLGDDDIVTCLYAVYDPADRSLTYANAGHLPPLLTVPGEPTQRLTRASGLPLGAGPLTLTEERILLPVGATVTLYTDGLVEQRDSDLDAGIDRLAAQLDHTTVPIEELPGALAEALLQAALDDDVAVLVAQARDDSPLATTATLHLESDERAVQAARAFVAATVREWDLPADIADDIVLLVSELVTNAVLYGRPPVELRIRRGTDQVVLDVADGATTLPRRLRPTPEDEHGRGLQLVTMLTKRWGTRPTPHGKAVWCVVSTGQNRGRVTPPAEGKAGSHGHHAPVSDPAAELGR